MSARIERHGRRAMIASVLLLAGCGDPDAAREAAMAQAAEGADKVDCATDGATRFERICAVERSAGANGLILTVRSPSGSFRRLLVTRDGRGVIAADGADEARVALVGDGRIEVAIAGDRYRLPATVKK
jgi:hypothetical protein